MRVFATNASQGGPPGAERRPSGCPDAGSAGKTIDRTLLEALGGRLCRSQIDAFMKAAIEDAEGACRKMRNGTAHRDEIAALAHRLHGTATSFGLVRIGSAAAAIEQQARSGRSFVAAVTELASAVAETRRESLGEPAIMTDSDWRLEGEWIKNCNCAFGCPCDFNARPTHGECHGLIGMRIGKGHFNEVQLDGLTFVVTVSFPGALHEGNGQAQPIIEERATPEQRAALLRIISGQCSREGTLFHIFSLIVTETHEPIFAPVTFQFDKAARTARLSVPGVLETEVEPIRNPVTGAPHRIQVVMPEGFEHIEGEIASADIESTGAIRFATKGTHSTLAHVVQTPQGVAA
jgi:hypothetical protein